jgi:hypothetical protein
VTSERIKQLRDCAETRHAPGHCQALLIECLDWIEKLRADVKAANKAIKKLSKADKGR